MTGAVHTATSLAGSAVEHDGADDAATATDAGPRLAALAQAARSGAMALDAAIQQAAELAEHDGTRRARGSFFTPDDVSAYATGVSLIGRILAGTAVAGQFDAAVTRGADATACFRDIVNNAEPGMLRAVHSAASSVVVIDLTCGAGAFLLQAFRLLEQCRSAMESRMRELQVPVSDAPPVVSQLHGADVAPLAVNACRLVLELETARVHGWPAAAAARRQLLRNVRQLDATRCLPERGWLPERGSRVLLGNPPWLRARRGPAVTDLATADCGNLYGWIFERGLQLLRPGDAFGMVVPVSAICTDAFEPLRSLLEQRTSQLWVSSYDTVPATLFPGTVQRAAIVLGRCAANGAAPPLRYTSRYHRWRTGERNQLFANIRYVPMPAQRVRSSWPKVGSEVEARLLARLFGHSPAGELLDDRGDGSNRFWYKRRWSYFLLFTDFMPPMYDAEGEPRPPTEFKPVDVCGRLDASVLLAAYNSTLFYWFFTVFSDNRNVNRRDIAAFPFSAPTPERASQLGNLGRQLMDALRASSELRTCTYRSIGTVRNTYFRQATTRPVLDRIDTALAEHYGMSDDELEFVLDFDATYRGGPGGCFG